MLYEFDFRTSREKSIHFPHLIYERFNFTKYLGGLIGRNETLQLLYLFAGIKPGARVLIDERAFDLIHEIFLAQGLFSLKSEFYVVTKDIRGAKYTYQKTSSPKGKKRGIFAYFAPDKKLCASLKKSEENSDNYRLGKLLGYPDCCIKNFANMKHDWPGNDILNSIQQPSFTFYSYLNNVALWPFNIKILCHFPCRQDCKHSLALGSQYISVLKKINENYSKFLEEELKSLIICSRNGNMVYSTNYIKNDWEIKIHQIKGDPRDPLYKLIKKHGVLSINDITEIRITKKVFAWPETKMALYA